MKSNEVKQNMGEAKSCGDHEHDVGPYITEPIPDDKSLANYRKKIQSYDERLKEIRGLVQKN